MTSLEMEMAHLTRLISAPSFPAWLEYAEWKARVLAQKYPETYANLPMLLSRAVSALPPSSTSSEKPSEQLGTDEPDLKPAATSTTVLPASIGQPPTSSLEG